MGPRAHHELHSSYEIEENSVEWLCLRGYDDLQYILHVHRVGITLPEAQKLVDEHKPGYKVLGFELCDPPDDDNKKVGSFIILQPHGPGNQDIKNSW